MFPLVTGALGALGVLGNLLQPQATAATNKATATAQDFLTGAASEPAGSSSPSNATSCAGGCRFSPGTMASLIDLQSQQSGDTLPGGATSPFQGLFKQIDSNGDGGISQPELEQAMGSGNSAIADALFAKLDTNGDGSVSQDELATALRNAHRHHHHHHHWQETQTADPPTGGTGTTDPTTSTTATAGA